MIGWALLAGALLAPSDPEACPAPAAAPARQGTILAVSGGASRGAYQAGVLYALLHAPASDQAPEGEPQVRFQLAGFAGASIGSINALIGALEHCTKKPAPRSADESLLWELWRELSWEAMFPGDLSCSEYRLRFPWLDVTCGAGGEAFGPADGVITASSFSALRHRLRDLLADTERYGDCRVPLTVSLTAERPAQLALGRYKVPTGRRLASFELRAVDVPAKGGGQAPGKALLVCQTEARALPPVPDMHEESAQVAQLQRLQLPTRRHGRWPSCDLVDPELFLDTLFASAAQPPYLPSIELSYCDVELCPGQEARGFSCPAQRHACKGRFLDGAFFDHQPLYAALSQHEATGASTPADILMVTPTRPTDPAANAPAQPAVQPRGFAAHKRQVTNFVDVAGHYELQTLERYRRIADDQPGARTPHIELVGQSRTLVADLQLFDDSRLIGGSFGGMAAFFDVDFRRHDYYLGIHDGLEWLFEHGQAATPEERRKLWARLFENAKVDETPGLGFAVRSAAAERTSPWIGCQIPTSALDSINNDRAFEGARRRQAERVAAVACALDIAVVTQGKLLIPWGDGARASDQFGIFAEALDSPISLPGSEPIRFDPADERPYVKSYRTWRYDLLRQALRRMGEVERQDGSSLAMAFALGEYGAAIAASTWRDGWSLGSSTIPQRIEHNALLSSLEKLLLPAAFRFRGRGRAFGIDDFGAAEKPENRPAIELAWDLIGYHFGAPDRPSTAELRHHFETQISLTQVYTPAPDVTPGWNLGLNASYSVDPLVFSGSVSHLLEYLPQLGVRVRYAAWGVDLPHSRDDGQARPWALDLFARPLVGRLEIGVRKPHLGEGGGYLYLGINDLNGLVYWLLRGMTGSDDAYRSLANAALQKAPAVVEKN